MFTARELNSRSEHVYSNGTVYAWSSIVHKLQVAEWGSCAGNVPIVVSLWLWCRRGVPGLWTKVGTLCYHTFSVESICSELRFNPVHRVAVVQTDYASVYQIRKYFFLTFCGLRMEFVGRQHCRCADGMNASEVTTLWRYTNLFIIIIITNGFKTKQEKARELRKRVCS